MSNNSGLIFVRTIIWILSGAVDSSGSRLLLRLETSQSVTKNITESVLCATDEVGEQKAFII